MKTPKSDITKKYSSLYKLYLALSIIVTIVPVIVYIALGLANGEIHQKVVLGVTLVIAMLLTGINVVFKFHIRSVIWILVLGIYICLDNILPLLLIIAIGTILDEFVLTPLYKSYRNKAKINLEIDKRLP